MEPRRKLGSAVGTLAERAPTHEKEVHDVARGRRGLPVHVRLRLLWKAEPIDSMSTVPSRVVLRQVLPQKAQGAQEKRRMRTARQRGGHASPHPPHKPWATL